MDFDDLLLNTNIPDARLPGGYSPSTRTSSRHILRGRIPGHQLRAVRHHPRRLGELHGNVCVVGDDAQSICSFRGADRNILRFQQDFPGAKAFQAGTGSFTARRRRSSTPRTA
ncbi:MAG: UvrD-helicase domain-containing protein [Alistipes indistinctus]